MATENKVKLNNMVGEGQIDRINLDNMEENIKVFGFQPYNPKTLEEIGVLQTYLKYKNVLHWGQGQTLAIIDDGCDMTTPEWQVKIDGKDKVVATYDSIDDDDNCSPGPNGHHGTSVGYPSSLNYNNVCGVAFNNFVAMIRGGTTVHLRQDETITLARALDWVINNYKKYNITTVNFSFLDDVERDCPMDTILDDKFLTLKKLGIWVSSPCGNNSYVKGISWPACQPHCFGIGAYYWWDQQVVLDRYKNTDIVVAADATSSSNAYIVGSSMILREAISVANFDWKKYGDNLPDAMMNIFKLTGKDMFDEKTGITFKALNLVKAVDFVFENK